jgi:hypothetical protein
MSYRNPKQYIDTQSGKYYVDMINKISAEGRANVQAIRKSNAERVRKNEATLSGIEKESLKLRTDFTKAAVSNGGLDLYKGFEPYIDEYSQIAQRLAFGTSENPTLDKKRQAQILALPQMANEGISMLLDAAEQTREAASIKGMGGLDLKASDEDNLRAALTWLDNVKGSRNYTVVEEGGTLVPAFEINGKQYSTNSIKKHIEEEYGIVFGTKIPDETSNFQEAAKLSMITDPNNVENKILDPKYLSEEVKQSKPDKNGVVTLYKEINKDALAASPVGVDLKADAGALLKMPGVEAISFWNNILDPEGDFPWDYKEILTKEQKDQFIDQYVEYGLSNYIQQQHKVGERKIEKPEKLTAAETKAAKTAKEIAETAPRVYTDIFKNPESYFKNKKIGGKDVLKVNVSPGSVPAGGGEVYPIIELGYKSGTSTKGGEQTMFTSDMIFDLSDPTRVRALIDMLPEGADMKKELKKLVGDNPIESVSIETFEQNPPIYKGISL